jgi:flagellar biosynthesis/type III secretory pathway M-ring protein FliF/YscJ
VKEIFRQLATIWREMKPLQKGASLVILLLVALALSLLLFKTPSSTFVPLFPGKALTSSEINEIRSHLDHFSISFKEDKEKGISVLSEHAEQIRCELAEAGIPKLEGGKGFELFDTNTWIKGEKELQVLEMRALKGQLEKDLSAFEHIKNASVILDIPPQKSFGGAKYQTKASVILTLMPQARLPVSELRAITNHLAGAVRGLEPNMIAISDTSGKLYKAIDPNGAQEPFNDARSLFEEHLEKKISELLAHSVGEGHYYTTVQATLERETETLLSLSLVVVIDQGILTDSEQNVRQRVTKQLASFAKGYGLDVEPLIDFIPFDKGRVWVEKKKRGSTVGLIFTLVLIAAALAALLPFLKRYKKKRENSEEALFRMMTQVDVNKLADAIQHEDPQTIALMLSYLEPSRAEQIIAALNTELQVEVLNHLSEMEKEGR